MVGMWIANIDVTDATRYGAYVERATEILTAHGARFVARGGRYEQMEGKDRARNVIAVFPTFEDAVNCYRSPEYQQIAPEAIGASDRTVVIVETED